MAIEKIKILKSNVLKMDSINWQELQFIQQDDFKYWTDEAKSHLKNSVVKNQFTQPFYVWQNPNEAVIYCLDGRHRILILKELIYEGVTVPDELPAIFINCRDKKEAAELVLQYSSAYAKISQQGFFDFATMYGLDFEDIKERVDLPNLELDQMQDWFLPPVPETELIGLAKHNPLTMKITFKTKAEYETAEPKIKALLQEYCPEAFYSVGGGEL
jgi:hypothetical protein